jgi:hypothetical protein
MSKNIIEFGIIRLGIIRYALTQSNETKDWRKIVIFHTNIKYEDKSCKIIIGNRSYINAVSLNTLAHLGLKHIPHLKPYSMSWVNNTSIVVKERFIFPIKLLDYHDEIWYDVISMDVGYIILSRLWIYKLDFTIFSQSNSCSFTFKGRKSNLLIYLQGIMIRTRKGKIGKKENLTYESK